MLIKKYVICKYTYTQYIHIHINIYNIYIYIYIYVYIYTHTYTYTCPPSYHHNDFVATPALGRMMWALKNQILSNVHLRTPAL